jgi:3-phenylpropionate/trans-cinnamate dioxygenase ferredoxin reductase subunit
VLIGGSYIGCEVAASLVAADHASCEIVMQEAVTLSRGFGETAGRWFQERLEEHGIVVHGDDELDRFEGADGRVTHVVTKGGKRLEADCVVIGAGVMPDVMLARSAGLTLDEERGGVLCDAQLRTSAPGVWAAGDVASYESRPNGRRIRVEHWDVAFNHGKTVALNMLGQEVEHDVVPYFFSDLADWASLEYVGPAASWDREIVRGSLEEGKFSVWYLAEGRVEGALSVGRSDDLEHARRLIAGHAELGDLADALGDLGSDLAAL